MKPLSVVIPTCGRRESLKALLAEILKSQDVVEEVLVAFDTAAPDESLAAGFPGVRVCSTGGEKGPAAARNAGARLARAEFLVFVDDDVVTAPGSIEAMAAALREGEGRVALAGQVVRHPSVRETAYVRFAYGGAAHTTFPPAPQVIDAWRFCGSFAAVPREVFLAVDGLDESFHGYEEVELAFRLKARGVVLKSCPKAVGYHLNEMSREWFIRYGGEYSRGLPRLLRLHPEAKKPVHRVMDRLGLLRPLFRFGWWLGKVGLPVLEHLPPALALPFLRAIHAAGLSAVYLDESP